MYLKDPAVVEAAVSQKSEALSSLLDEYERDLGKAGPSKFLNNVRLIIRALVIFHREALAYVRANYQDDPSAVSKQIGFYSNYVLKILVRIHEEYLQFFDSGASQYEHSVLKSIVRAVHLFEVDADVTLVPQFEYCYGFVGFQDFVSRLLGTIEKHSPVELSKIHDWSEVRGGISSPKLTAFLLYPVVERDSVLRLAVLAHELAHLVDQAKLLYRELLPLKLHSESFTELVSKFLERRVGPPEAANADAKSATIGSFYPKDLVEAGLFRECNSRLEFWLKELIADLLAVHALGPAYCFSFVEFLAHGSVENEPDDQHDQPAYRLGLIFDEIEYLGYFQSQNGIAKVLSDMRSAAKAQSSADYNLTSRVVHKTIEQHLPDIQAKLRIFIQTMKFSFTFAHYTKEVPPIVESLLKGISPAESYDELTKTSGPSSVPAIINAGWEVYATRLDKFVELFRPELGRVSTVVNLNELLFHAIESSEVVRVWNKTGR